LEISYQLPGTSQPVTAAISDGDDSFTIPLEAAQAAEMVPDLEEDPLPLVIPVTLRAQAAGNLSLAFSVELTSVPGAGTVFGRSDLDFTRVDAAAECAAPTSSVGISPVHQPSPAVEATAAPATVTSQVTQYWCLTVRYRGDGTYQSTATVTAGTSLVSGTGTQTREATATWESAVRPNPANEPVGAVHLRIAPLPLGVVNNG
jgi:hypothetical protein